MAVFRSALAPALVSPAPAAPVPASASQILQSGIVPLARFVLKRVLAAVLATFVSEKPAPALLPVAVRIGALRFAPTRHTPPRKIHKTPALGPASSVALARASFRGERVGRARIAAASRLARHLKGQKLPPHLRSRPVASAAVLARFRQQTLLRLARARLRGVVSARRFSAAFALLSVSVAAPAQKCFCAAVAILA